MNFLINRKLLLTVFFISILTTFSCHKDSPVSPYPTGVVLDATTIKPVAGAWVLLVEYEICYSWLCPEKVVGEDTTDNLGHYVINYNLKNDYGYYLRVIAPRYFDSGRVGNGKLDKNNFDHIYLQPEAFLKVFIKNTTPYDLYDKILVGSYGTPSGGGGEFQGINVDTLTIARTLGNATEKIEWWVIKKSDTTKYSTSVYCPAFDTTVYQLNY